MIGTIAVAWPRPAVRWIAELRGVASFPAAFSRQRFSAVAGVDDWDGAAAVVSGLSESAGAHLAGGCGMWKAWLAVACCSCSVFAGPLEDLHAKDRGVQRAAVEAMVGSGDVWVADLVAVVATGWRR